MSARTAPMLTWSASLDRHALAADGYDVVEFSALRREIAASTRPSSRRRTSLQNPAGAWLARVGAAAGLAVTGVRLRDLADLQTLHGYVLEPALRCAVRLSVVDLLAAIEYLDESERASTMLATGLGDRELHRPITQLGAASRKRIVHAVRKLAADDAPPGTLKRS